MMALNGEDGRSASCAEALQNIKFQAPNFRVLGVGCQVSGVREEKQKN
jgi:hypothetical protein